MGALLHSSLSMAKRPCPSQIPRIHKIDRMDTDQLLESLLGLSDSCSLFIDRSLERLLNSTASEADQSLLIDRALKWVSIFVKAGKCADRKRASKHNFIAWVLPPDLTIKVFSML